MSRPRRAVTLAELVVVMAIVAVLMGVAAAQFAAWTDSAAVHAASAETLHAFAVAREIAITRRTFVSVRLDTLGGVVETRASGSVLRRRNLRTLYGVSVGANRDSMVYDPRGLGFGAANLSLVLRRGGAVDTITVSRLGRVK